MSVTILLHNEGNIHSVVLSSFDQILHDLVLFSDGTNVYLFFFFYNGKCLSCFVHNGNVYLVLFINVVNCYLVCCS